MGAVGRFFAACLAVVLLVWGFLVFIGILQSWNRPGATQVSVIRNGGMFDTKDIREVRAPASGYKVSGLFSEVRQYIAGNEQRYYKVSSDPSLGSQSGAAFIKIPTKDGVNVEVDAQITFRTDFTSPSGEVTVCKEAECDEFEYLVEKFDTQYGNRDFNSKSGGTKKVWDGNSGWNAFLDSMFRPVVENAFRAQIGSVNCADLVSSCALVQSSNQEVNVNFSAKDNRENFERIQENVQTQIETGVRNALHGEYLTGFSVQLTKVTLPQRVQGAINEAQASFADIATARAQKISANYQAEANERLAKAYDNNPNLAYIKAVESLKNSNATVILGEPGTGLVLGK